MKKTFAALLGALVLTATPVLAGEGHGCSAPTQDCLDHMAKSLQTRGWVGVHLEPADEGRMRIVKVIDESPAEAAGLMKGDVLVSAEGLRYGKASEEEWGELMKGWTPGRTITYGIHRDGEARKLRLKLAEMPPQVRYQMVGHHMMEHAKVAQAVN
jgi:C-terminal processing protease CtpA/Prc